MVGFNISEEIINASASFLGCKSSSLPFKYLGVPLGVNLKIASTWKPVIDKIDHKLIEWKGKFLSIAGRLTLIKSSLHNLPLYFLSIFIIPKSVALKIEAIFYRFLWFGNAICKKINLVKWASLLRSKVMGDLNIQPILHKNAGLLFKWLWRLASELGLPCAILISSKYHYYSSRWSPNLSISHMSSIWRGIHLNLFSDPVKVDLILKTISFSIGNSSSIKFWHNNWISSSPVRIIFPRLFKLSLMKNSYIADFGYWDCEKWTWSLS